MDGMVQGGLMQGYGRQQAGLAEVYTDFSGLDRLKGEEHQNKEGALQEVAQQFESIFLRIVLKSMRDANQVFSEGNYFNSQQGEMYQNMLDQQLSLTLSKGRGVGLAESLVEQLRGYLPENRARETGKILAVDA